MDLSVPSSGISTERTGSPCAQIKGADWVWVHSSHNTLSHGLHSMLLCPSLPILYTQVHYYCANKMKSQKKIMQMSNFLEFGQLNICSQLCWWYTYTLGQADTSHRKTTTGEKWEALKLLQEIFTLHLLEFQAILAFFYLPPSIQDCPMPRKIFIKLLDNHGGDWPWYYWKYQYFRK